MMEHQATIFLVLAFLASAIRCEERTPYDPSTVINVYPSLQHLKPNGGGGGGGDTGEFTPVTGEPCIGDGSTGEDEYDDYDSCGAAASNPKPTWTTKNGSPEDESAPVETPVPIRDFLRNHNKDLKKPKYHSRAKSMKEEEKSDSAEINKSDGTFLHKLLEQGHTSPENERVHNWNSFQDMLQLLRKRKH